MLVFPLGHLVNDWPGATLWLLAPAMAVSLDLSAAEVGLLLTVHGLGASLGYLPAGLLADWFKRRGVLLAITFWWVAIGYFVVALATEYWAIALILAFAGMGDAAWHPVAATVMVEQTPGRRARAIGIHALGGTPGRSGCSAGGRGPACISGLARGTPTLRIASFRHGPVVSYAASKSAGVRRAPGNLARPEWAGARLVNASRPCLGFDNLPLQHGSGRRPRHDTTVRSTGARILRGQRGARFLPWPTC